MIRARDIDAKQTLWGWGSDKRPSIEFYGRDIGMRQGDQTLWEWKLSPEGVTELRRNLTQQLARPQYYEVSKRESLAARQLKAKLDKIASSCPRPRKR